MDPIYKEFSYKLPRRYLSPEYYTYTLTFSDKAQIISK